MNANILKQLADIQIQPHPNGDGEIAPVRASGETTSDVFTQRSTELQPAAHLRGEGDVEITSDVMSQQPPELRTEAHTSFNTHDDAESTTTNASIDMIDLHTDIVEQHMDSDMMEPQNEIQSQPSHESNIDNNTNNAPSGYGIREYVNFSISSPDQPWLELPELPMAEEVGGFVGDMPAKLEHALQPNKIVGPWGSKEDYLRSHYELLREDAVAPLRGAVEEFHAKPNMMEKDSMEHAGIYEKVYIKGLTFTHYGIAVRVGFSLRRAGALIRWEQSKRLASGSIVALTHAHDKFDTVCKIAVVAARPLIFLYTDPPTVELYFNSVDELELDPQQEWIMIEARTGYYEANRHTLRALQKMSCEKFPLAEHIVDLEITPKAPEYVIAEPWKELSPALSNRNQYFGIDVLEDWPELPESILDESQLAALRRILTKRLAVVQGSPGCGKSFISAVALKIMRGNMAPADPPIIVTAQTNHALDQLLRQINAFESKFIRLGGRTADHVVVKPRTLFEIRKGSNQGKNSAVGPAMKKRLGISTEIRKMLDPLVHGTEPLTAEFLHSYGLLSRAQLDSLVDYAKTVKGATVSAVPGLMAMWLDEYLLPAVFNRHDDYANLELEEADLTFEQLKGMEVGGGSGSPDDDASELVRGEYIALVDPWTGHSDLSGDEKLEELLKKRQDLWRIPEQYRGSIYRYLQRKAKEEMRKRLRVACSKYMKVCQALKVAKWERDLFFLREARVIGMTTTGLSKYRGLIASLHPKVVLIEEAAETIEAHVTAACFDSLQHLILVGDHQQLRGHCAVPELERHPWNLAVSLFERLIKNNFEFSQLTRQRRMRPEIRRIINPIYPQLQDHPCVEEREDVPGMGGVNSWFHTHEWYESNDNNMSKQNLGEAEMVVGLFDYLVHNGVEVQHITILTFYNGQRKKILDLLRRHHQFQGNYHFKVATVDSYQGEENEIVLLSLVRNNPSEIGFLSFDNRICVALSRARRGFYIFGNHSLLAKKSSLWTKVLKVLARKPSRIGRFLPITCGKHGMRTNITCAADWDHINGGCALKCDGVLACGHACPSNCHPFPHSHIRCRERCAKIMPGCHHRCIEECHIQPCRCQCRKQPTVPRLPFQFLPKDPVVDQAGPSTSRAPTKKGNVAGDSPEAWKARAQKEARGQGPAGNKSGFGKRKVSFSQLLTTGTNGTPQHRNQMGKPQPRQTTAQIQAWGDFAAGGHVKADQKIQDANMDKMAKAYEKRAEEKRQLADAENEKNLFGKEDGPTQTDMTAAIGGEQSGPAQTESTAAVGEVEATVEGDLLGPGTPPPNAVAQADLLQLVPGAETSEMSEMRTPVRGRVRRVEEWRPASPGRDTEGRKEEVSLLDMENNF